MDTYTEGEVFSDCIEFIDESPSSSNEQESTPIISLHALLVLWGPKPCE